MNPIQQLARMMDTRNGVRALLGDRYPEMVRLAAAGIREHIARTGDDNSIAAAVALAKAAPEGIARAVYVAAVVEMETPSQGVVL